MTGKNRDRSRSWQPLERVEHVVNDKLANTTDLRLARQLRRRLRNEMWANNKYAVILERNDDGHAVCLSIRRVDGRHMRDWRDLQRIKNELAGEDCEAVELFPAEDRLVDTANQTYLWVFPPGLRLPLGFSERLVQAPGEGIQTGQVQRPFDDDGTSGQDRESYTDDQDRKSYETCTCDEGGSAGCPVHDPVVSGE